MGRIDGNDQQIQSRLHAHYQQALTGDGVTTTFFLAKTPGRVQDVTVTVGGARMKVSDRGTANDFAIRGLTPGFPGDRNAIIFTAAPAMSAVILVDLVST